VQPVQAQRHLDPSQKHVVCQTLARVSQRRIRGARVLPHRKSVLLSSVAPCLPLASVQRDARRYSKLAPCPQQKVGAVLPQGEI
jgi:hypothetical protein